FPDGGIRSGKVIVVVIGVEAAIFGNNRPGGKEIRSEPFVLPAQFRAVENAADIVPAESTDQSFVAIAEFLTADFEGEGKFLVVADGDVGLVEINGVLLRPVSSVVLQARRQRVGEESVPLVIGGKAAAALHIRAPPFVG